MEESTGIKTLEARCFCGSVHLTFDVPVSSLPLSSYCCHCSVCRYMTGAPCIFHSELPEQARPTFIGSSIPGNMTSYVMKGASARMMFCSTCGCHIAGVGIDDDSWVIATSIFVDHGPENFQYTKHFFTKSARDGGISSLLSHLGNRQLGVWNPPESDDRAKLVECSPEVGRDGEERLRVQCHCGGVSFVIRRPTQQVLDDEFLFQFVSPLDNTKWLALLDVCNDCRLVNGTHVVGWTFLPLSICEPAIKSDLKIGTSKTISTSPGVLRSFCGTCGATVFYSNQIRQPDEERQVVDLATGIIRAPEGVMAEHWLTWRTRLGWTDKGIGYDKELGQALEEGMKKWTVEKYGREIDVEIT